MTEIRHAKPSDVKELMKLNILFNGENCTTYEKMEDSIRSNKDEVIYVASDEDKLVGFCCASIMKSACYSYLYGEVTELFVLKEYRRQGIGKELLQHTEKELSRYGVTHIHILTRVDNSAAKTLYHSCGYNDTPEMLLDKNL